jgi:hypothetical protein
MPASIGRKVSTFNRSTVARWQTVDVAHGYGLLAHSDPARSPSIVVSDLGLASTVDSDSVVALASTVDLVVARQQR